MNCSFRFPSKPSKINLEAGKLCTRERRDHVFRPWVLISMQPPDELERCDVASNCRRCASGQTVAVRSGTAAVPPHLEYPVDLL